jgi:hypothetical protein
MGQRICRIEIGDVGRLHGSANRRGWLLRSTAPSRHDHEDRLGIRRQGGRHQGLGHGLVTHGIRYDQHAFFGLDVATRFDGDPGAPLQFYRFHVSTSNSLVA